MIQWFPGHMAKASRLLAENLDKVDIVIELIDARAPAASQNPLLEEIIEHKKTVLVFMKKDLADETRTTRWLEVLQNEGKHVIAIDVNVQNDLNNLVRLVTNIGLEEQKKRMEKGAKRRAVRALVVGIPNVGKSTLINRLAKKKIAKIGDRPGITRKQQWIKVENQFELLDTPGILWPKFESETVGMKLAAIGSIKYELVPKEDVAAFILQYVAKHYPGKIEERFQIEWQDDMWKVFEQIGRRRGVLQSGGKVNFAKVAEIVLLEFRTGKLGRITLEAPEEYTTC